MAIGRVWANFAVSGHLLVLHNQLIQHDAAAKDGIVSTAMGGVDFIELFPPGGDFPFQGFDGFGFSIRHGLPF